MLEKIPLSVVVLTKNEEDRIVSCLTSVEWADEIIVVDDDSTDRTREIAQGLGAKVFIKKMEVEGKHRNWAYAQAKNIWVLSLDADEIVTPELKKEIMHLFKQKMGFEAYTIPRRNFIGKYWIRYGGEYPAAQLRLFKKDNFRYEEVSVHPRAFLNGKRGHLKHDLIHYSWKDFADFLAKLNRQTSWEAQKWITTGRKMSMLHAFWRVLDRFFRRYFRKKGYKDRKSVV